MPRLPSFFQRYRDRGLLLLLVALALVLRSSSEELRFQSVRRVAALFYAPSNSLVRLGNYLSQWGGENDRLAERLMSQAQQWESVQELRRENERLRSMLGFSSGEAYRFLPAQLLSFPVGIRERDTVRIDQGREQGVEPGMPVVCFEGLVGRVESADANGADVLLLRNKNFALGARDLRSRVLGVFKWDPRRGFHIDRVDPAEDVQVGDRFVTSGGGSEFPAGFLLGTVTQVRHRPGGLRLDVSLRTAAPLSRLENVFVVTAIGEQAGGFPLQPEGEAP